MANLNNQPQQADFGNWLDEFEESKAQQAPPDNLYPNPAQSVEDQISAMPNSDKLTGFERWVYRRLPGFSESTVGKALMAFGDSPAGKALNVLDVFAEGAERTLGLLAQLRDLDPEDEFVLKDAWSAGSLFWDVAQLPRFAQTEDGFGVQIDSALPGAVALTEARKLLGEGKSLDEIRENMYSNMGALALRAQLQDTLGHIAVDPLSWMLGAVKPVERLHAIRNLALTGKMDVEVMQAAELTARVAGDLQKAEEIAAAITKAQKTGKALNRVDKFAIMITGGLPYMEKTKDGLKMLDVATQTPLQKALSKFNPFALTPQARASELLDMVAANVGEQLVRKMWNSDPEEFIKAVSGAARGSIGEQWGHLAATIQGRTTQAILSQADATVRALGAEWSAVSKERSLLARLAAVMEGKDERSLWLMAKNSPEALWKQLQEAVVQNGDAVLLKAIQDGQLTPKQIADIGLLDNSIPLLREEFYAKALISIEDVAMRQSILQFGIKEKGVLTKWSDALKAWESLPFIKANPANMVRNIVNNDVTLMGRGLFGTMLPRHIDDFWKGKYMPKVFERGFGLGGDAAQEALAGAEKFDPGSAIQALEEALTGKMTFADKVKEAAGKVDLKAFDFSKYSAKAERAASKRASTMGWLQFHQQYWNAKTGFTSVSKYLDPALLDELEAVAPGLSRVLDEVAQSSGADSEKFAKLMQSSIEHNPALVLNNAEEALGFKLADVMGADTIHRIQDGLPKAMEEGRVTEFLDGLKLEMEQHVDDMFNKHVENLPGIIAAQVQAGGPQQFHRIFGKAVDEFWGGNTEHAIRMSTINEALDYAKRTGDYKKVSSLWNKIMTDSENHFGRVWKKFEAYEEGLRQGAKNAGIKYPKEVSSSFKEIKTGWERFFEYRNNAYKELFEGGGKSGKDFDAIQKTLDTMYDGLAKKEDELYQRIDDLMVESFPDNMLKSIYGNYRDQAGKLRLADRQHTQQFYQKLRTADPDDVPNLWSQYWKERGARVEQIRQLERRGSAAIQGDSEAIQMFLRRADDGTEPTDVVGLANKYNIATASGSGARNNRRILNTVNKYLPEGVEKFKNVDDIPVDVAKQAFEARLQAQTAEITQAAQRSFVPDADQIFKDPMPMETAISELNYGRGYAAMDAIADEAIGASAKKSRLIQDLDPKLQKQIEHWMKNVDNEMSSFRAAGVQYAAFRRDSALLNYNRRTNFDNMLGHIAPFAFWTTHSAFNWAIHSLDRPAMLTSYFRARQFFETAGLQDQNVPTRLKGHIRIGNLPFAPEWMGDVYANPMRFALPFDGFMTPWERSAQEKKTTEGKAKDTLNQMLEEGVITQDQFNQAVETQSGDVWDRALQTVEAGGEDYDAMDFVTTMTTPHAPIMWAYNAMSGQPNEIGPFTPMTKTVRNLATMMGVEDWSNSPYNVEARIRKHMGLPAYDKWEDYRVQREISNMAADGGEDMEDVKKAMEVAALVESGKMTPEEAKQESELYKKAIQRSNIESGGWWAGALGGVLGIPIKAYPTGEKEQRELGEQFSVAIQAREKGDPEALTKFFDEHPEYESRLALFKSPEERLKTFMIDNMWQRWNELPKVNQDEIRDQLGENFEAFFLTKETRSYETIKPEQLQIWLALTKAKQVGRLAAETEALIELNQLKLTDPETAWRVQTFYDARKNEFPDFYKAQNGYYALPEGSKARKQYLAQNPGLKQYWDFRRKWMEKNPDLVRFLTDDEKQLAKYAKMKRDTNDRLTAPTREELMQNFSPEMQELLQGWTLGESLPPEMEGYMEQVANMYGVNELTVQTMAGILTGQR